MHQGLVITAGIIYVNLSGSIRRIHSQFLTDVTARLLRHKSRVGIIYCAVRAVSDNWTPFGSDSAALMGWNTCLSKQQLPPLLFF